MGESDEGKCIRTGTIVRGELHTYTRTYTRTHTDTRTHTRTHTHTHTLNFGHDGRVIAIDR